MTTPTRSIYLSAVCAELKSYRDELTHNLTQRGFLVKCREDFEHAGNLLEKLEEYIRGCDVVICLIGNQYGEEPSPEEAEGFADIAKGRHSYAQWEYLFGAHIGKSVYAFCPTNDTPRNHRNEESAELAGLQEQFRRTWIDSEVNGKPIEFNDQVSLRVEALVLKELTPEIVDPPIARKLNLENPYVGLRKFTETDSDMFFGRKNLADKIVKRIGLSPVLTVFGTPGAGKSSIVRAGVIPIFRNEYPTGKVIVFNPGHNPFESFANGLSRAGLPELAPMAKDPTSDLFLKVRNAAGNPKEPWLIFIDQFEEIFSRPDKRETPLILQFVQSLINMPSVKQAPALRIVLAIRDDFIGRLSEYKGLSDLTDQSLIRVTRPDWAELCEIIELPAASHGVRFEPNLVSRIVSHVEGEGQNLPNLQYALYRLWEVEKHDMNQFAEGTVVDKEDEKMGGLHDRRINRISYKALNGVPHALATRIDELFGQQSSTQRRQLRDILLSLVSIAETDTGLTAVSSPASFTNLLDAGGPDSETVLNTMLDEGLLIRSETGEGFIELAHEALLFEWKALTKWVNDIRDAVEMRRQLFTDSRNWESRQSKLQATYEDLWGGAKLERALELNRRDEASGKSDFDRIGGLGDLEHDFLAASGDRSIKEIRANLAESTEAWKTNRKSKDLLWAGPKLNRALEMNQAQPGEVRSRFERIGGLEKAELKFLSASEKHSQPKPKLTYLALGIAIILALLGFFTPLGNPGAGESTDQAGLMKWIKSIFPTESE